MELMYIVDYWKIKGDYNLNQFFEHTHTHTQKVKQNSNF